MANKYGNKKVYHGVRPPRRKVSNKDSLRREYGNKNIRNDISGLPYRSRKDKKFTKGVAKKYGSSMIGEAPGVEDRGGLMPTWSHTRDTPFVSAWDDNYYLLLRDITLDFTTNIATQQAWIEGPLLQAYDPSQMKDWDSTQRDYFEELIFYGAGLLADMACQCTLRRLQKLLTESDASAYWTAESYATFLNGVEERNLYVPIMAVNLARLYCVGWVRSPPDPISNLPPSIAMTCRPNLTLANAKTLRDGIISRQAGKLHAAKTKMPMVKITRDLIENGIYSFIKAGSEEATFYWLHNIMNTRDNAGTSLVVGDTTVLPNANTTTGWTTRQFIWKGERPNDIWACFPLLHYYHATNNPMGMVTCAALGSNNTLGWTVAGQNDTALSQLAFSYGGNIVDICAAVQNYGTYTFSATSGSNVVKVMSCLNGDNVHYKTGVSQDESFDLLRAWFSRYMNKEFKIGGILDAGTKENTIAK